MDAVYNALKMEEITDQYDSTEMEQQKGLTIVAFIFWILFFLPVVSNKESAYAKTVANQVLTLFICGIANSFVIHNIPAVGGFLYWIIELVLWAVAVLKIVDAAQGRIRKNPFGFELPVFK